MRSISPGIAFQGGEFLDVGVKEKLFEMSLNKMLCSDLALQIISFKIESGNIITLWCSACKIIHIAY